MDELTASEVNQREALFILENLVQLIARINELVLSKYNDTSFWNVYGASTTDEVDKRIFSKYSETPMMYVTTTDEWINELI
jgi:hypothetical protein